MFVLWSDEQRAATQDWYIKPSQRVLVWLDIHVS